jgi:putative Mg2+ transporter-C (MgtC) family protein
MLLDWHILLTASGKILAAYLLALPTGWFREKEAHAVGIRTFPIVAMASCGYLLLMQGDGSPQDVYTAGSRVLQGLIAGIGFVGGGAILKDGGTIQGTATAASIWNTGAIGAATALGKYEIAIVLSLLNLFSMRALAPVKKRIDTAVEAGKGTQPNTPVS